jgi:uncharacterized protein YciI
MSNDQGFDFHAMTTQGNDTGLPLLYAMVMTPLPLAEAPGGPVEPSPLEVHYEYIHRLIEAGKVLLIGPCTQEPPRPGDAPVPPGIAILRVASRAEADEIAHNEPFHKMGWRHNQVMAWTVKFGSLIPTMRDYLKS